MNPGQPNISPSFLLLERIKRFLELKKVYLTDLKLYDIASELSTSSVAVSHAIHEFESCHFTDFINQYRVEEAKRLILDESRSLKIIQIAYLSGFNNKFTFNVAFKKFVGMSPSEFRRQNTQSIIKLNL